jgi:hypothetical protein
LADQSTAIVNGINSRHVAATTWRPMGCLFRIRKE